MVNHNHIARHLLSIGIESATMYFIVRCQCGQVAKVESDVRQRRERMEGPLLLEPWREPGDDENIVVDVWEAVEEL